MVGVKDNLIYEECMKELNTMFRPRQEKRSFGKYFDDQRDRIVSAMQTGKNTELYNAWREDYDERQMTKKRKKYKKELIECRMFNPINDNSDKWWKENNENAKENSERS